MSHLAKVLTLSVASLSLIACSSTPDPMYGPDIQDEDSRMVGGNAGKSGVETSGILRDRAPQGVEVLNPERNQYGIEIIDLTKEGENGISFSPILYFGLDQYEITEDMMETIRYYADLLKSNPNLDVKFKGHTDERGSSSYNLALGERRAYAVRDAFISFGIAADRLEATSYGEEEPAVAESNESAWAQNRRVEIIIK